MRCITLLLAGLRRSARPQAAGRAVARRARRIAPHGLYTAITVAAPSIRTMAPDAAISTRGALPGSEAVNGAVREVAAMACRTAGKTTTMLTGRAVTVSASFTTTQECVNR